MVQSAQNAATAPNTPPANPLDASNSSKKDSVLLKNIVSTETGTKEEQILDTAPEIDMSLLKDIAPPKSLLLLIFKTFFAILIVASAASYLFFTSQLTNHFDFAASSFDIPNISKELASSNSEIINLQTNVNLYRFLQIKAFLDEFTYYGDSYVQAFDVANSQTASNSDKKDATEKMALSRDYLRKSFIKIKDKLVLNFTAPLIQEGIENDADLKNLFKRELITLLNDKADSFSDVSTEDAKRDYKNYMHTMTLVGNQAFNDLIVKTDFDALSDQDLYSFVKNINSVVVNDLSIIQEIKDQRIKWSDIINEIELRTIAVDSYYTEDYYDELGGIRYTSYDFDVSGPSISIVGETKRFDTTNFTMIANLIDELNRSDFFKNAGMNSFTKSGSIDTGYTASLKLTLGLESEESDETDEKK